MTRQAFRELALTPLARAQSARARPLAAAAARQARAPSWSTTFRGSSIDHLRCSDHPVRPADPQAVADRSPGEDQKAWDQGVEAIKKSWDTGIEPHTSLLLGGDQDDEGIVDRRIEFAEVSRIRKAEFAIAMPYPGTPEWHALVAEERILTRDWSKYIGAHVVFRPARMTPEQVEDGYPRLWRDFYASRGHLADSAVAERTIQF